MAHRDAREGKWRGNWSMDWVASTLHTTSEHGVSSITTADAHTLAASSRLNWCPRRYKWTRPFRRNTNSCFCTCAIMFQLVSTNGRAWCIIAHRVTKTRRFFPERQRNKIQGKPPPGRQWIRSQFLSHHINVIFRTTVAYLNRFKILYFQATCFFVCLFVCLLQHSQHGSSHSLPQLHPKFQALVINSRRLMAAVAGSSHI